MGLTSNSLTEEFYQSSHKTQADNQSLLSKNDIERETIQINNKLFLQKDLIKNEKPKLI